MPDNYEDIIHLPHHRSTRHPHMSRADRAAQFSPFASLTRFGEAIRETARQTSDMPLLSEDDKAAIDRLLHAAASDPSLLLAITHFVPDQRKSGGSFKTTSGRIKKLDPLTATVTLTDDTSIPIASITSVTLE